ncbi:MAG: hypothetical protein HY298_13675 [Verrucomicrobia bacterium]|nr:hypothetical protein [Verrucomicrobiota bacterium]
MQLRRPQIIVKIAAVISGLLALSGLTFIVWLASDLLVYHASAPRFYKELGVYALFAIVPLMFILAAIQAWRCIPKGIVSLSSGWILFGLCGSIVQVFWFFADWRIKDAIGAIIWICVFLFGVLVARQEKRIKIDAT